MYRTGDNFEATLLVGSLTNVQVEEEFNLILLSLLSALKTQQPTPDVPPAGSADALPVQSQ
jgi:hypothetical protein